MAAADPNRLILEAATGRQTLDEAELESVLRHIAQAGFHPASLQRVGGLGAGVPWAGRVTRTSDRFTAEVVHYLRHVLGQQEWPPGTTLAAYLNSLRDVILDARSGILTSRFEGEWQLTVVRRSLDLRGPGGGDWVLIEYRVGLGHLVTAFQPAEGLGILDSTRRTDRRWLRQPS